MLYCSIPWIWDKATISTRTTCPITSHLPQGRLRCWPRNLSRRLSAVRKSVFPTWPGTRGMVLSTTLPVSHSSSFSSPRSVPQLKKDVDELHREMAAFPVGTTLYTAYGCNAPKGDELLPTDGTVSQVCGDPVL